MTTLITGGFGSLGKELTKLFPDALVPSHEELDITDQRKVLQYFEKNDIDLIFHTAALTSVRQCEQEKDLAMKTNVEGTRNLVLAVAKTNPTTKFVYISTACVFDGHGGMYTETSIPYPENFYSLTKLLGEYEVKGLKSNLIVRTNFVPKIQWPYPGAFTDRFGTYLFSDQVAHGIKDIVQENLTGIIHIVGDVKLSMFELAKLTTPDIKPITINDYSGPRLTMDMSLDTIRWKKYLLG